MVWRIFPGPASHTGACMKEIAIRRSTNFEGTAVLALKSAARLWFVVATIGLWIFAWYLAFHYGGSALRGDFQAWNAVFPRGYVPGDVAGNLSVGSHVLLAAYLSAAGPLQLIPQIRSRFPTFHRWNGRFFIATASLASLAGIYLVWIRGGTTGDLPQHLGITLNAILIFVFAFFALRFAMARKIAVHQRWALRLFLVVNGVWFFRVGLMMWLLIHQEPVGFDMKTFTGPFLVFLSFAQTLLPLAFLELYLRARDSGSAPVRFTMAAVLIVATLGMGAGIFAATMNLWIPYL